MSYELLIIPLKIAFWILLFKLISNRRKRKKSERLLREFHTHFDIQLPPELDFATICNTIREMRITVVALSQSQPRIAASLPSGDFTFDLVDALLAEQLASLEGGYPNLSIASSDHNPIDNPIDTLGKLVNKSRELAPYCFGFPSQHIDSLGSMRAISQLLELLLVEAEKEWTAEPVPV